MRVRTEELCRRLPYWELLTEKEKKLVSENSYLRRFTSGELVHGGGRDCLGQVTVISGELRNYLLSDEGKEVTLFMLRRGEPCVLSSSCILSQLTFDTQISATEDTELLIVSLGVFQRISEENTDMKLYTYELALERFSQVMETMQRILFLSFDRRLAAFLVDEYERTGSPELRMTHEQIAARISSAREVVARMLKRFSAEGLVESERGMIRLTDIEGLRSLL